MNTDAERDDNTPLSQDRARELIQQMLDDTSWVDRFELDSDLDLFVVGFLQRCRRLARAFRVLDADEDEHMLEQEILLRALLEFVITLHWLLEKPDEHMLRLQWDEVSRIERSVWELDVLETQKGSATEFEAILAAKGRIEWAWRRLGKKDRMPRDLPNLAERAGAGGKELYALVYRRQSQAAAHPGAGAVRPLVAGIEGDRTVIFERVLVGPSVNPAGVALALLWHAFAFAHEQRKALPATDRLTVIGDELGAT